MRPGPTIRSGGAPAALSALFRDVVRNHCGLTPREQKAALTLAGLLLLGLLARCLSLPEGALR